MATAELDHESLVFKAVELQGAGDVAAASAIFAQVLTGDPAHPVALYSQAAISLNHGRAAEGLGYARRCLRAAPGSPLSWYIHAVALKINRHYDEALASLDQALKLDPHYVEALVERANIHLAAEDTAESLKDVERILSIQPGNAFAASTKTQLLGATPPPPPPTPAPTQAVSPLAIKGLELQTAGRIEEARKVFLESLKTPGNPFVALYSLAVISVNGGNPEEGLRFAEECLKNNPSSAHAWYISGCALRVCRRFPEAHVHFDRAIELNPTYKEAIFEKGITYGDTKDYVQALIQFNNLLQLDPEHRLALLNLATSLTILKRDDEASQFFSRLLRLDPDHDYALGALTHARLHSCNWTDFDANCEQINQGVRAGKRTCKPLAFLAISDSPADQLICAKTFSQQAYPSQDHHLSDRRLYPNHRKLRIGYVSPDLREHPVGHLTAGVFEHHDKEQFEIYAFSLGIDDNSSLRQRFIAASDRFIDVRGKTSKEIAGIIRESEIDLLIDLAGPTMDAQPDIFAYRPAPIQAGWLGYPGTSGASYFDFIIGDRTVIPEGDHAHYTEKVEYVPGCYLPTDSRVAIAERTPTRAEMQLPEEGFVFCSFNHDYKINPHSFGVWMRILQQVPGSVLWLMKLNEAAENNLRKEAAARGIAPERLIFATRVPAIEDHLARYRLAGLFLDTFPYNAHTTATDAIRVGLPVLTLTGKSFQSRVATSILNVLGMPDLSKPTLEEYERFAVEVGSDPAKAAALKQRLQEKLATTLLYDTVAITRGLEDTYRRIVARAQQA